MVIGAAFLLQNEKKLRVDDAVYCRFQFHNFTMGYRFKACTRQSTLQHRHHVALAPCFEIQKPRDLNHQIQRARHTFGGLS